MALGSCLLAMLLATVHADSAAETNLPILQFIEPTNNAVFSTLDEVPIVLRASAPNDVFLTADRTFADVVQQVSGSSPIQLAVSEVVPGGAQGPEGDQRSEAVISCCRAVRMPRGAAACETAA